MNNKKLFTFIACLAACLLTFLPWFHHAFLGVDIPPQRCGDAEYNLILYCFAIAGMLSFQIGSKTKREKIFGNIVIALSLAGSIFTYLLLYIESSMDDKFLIRPNFSTYIIITLGIVIPFIVKFFPEKPIINSINTGNTNVADELKKLKELLDQGAITQVNFKSPTSTPFL